MIKNPYLYKDIKNSKNYINFYFILFYISFNLIIFTLENGNIEESLWKWGSLHNVFVTLKSEWFRFLISSFLNDSILSFVFSTFFLFLFGQSIQFIYGYQQYVIILVSSSITSHFIAYFFVFPYVGNYLDSIEIYGSLSIISGFFGSYVLFIYTHIYDKGTFLKKLFFYHVFGLILFLGNKFLLIFTLYVVGFLTGVFISLFFNFLNKKVPLIIANKIKNILCLFLSFFFLYL